MAQSYNKILAIIAVNLLIGYGLSFAQQPPGLGWKYNYGGNKSDIGYDIIPTYSGQIAIIGETNSAPAKNRDATFLLLDENGKQIVQKIIGSVNDDVLTDISTTNDGGFVAAGYTNNTPNKQNDGWLVQLNENGDTLWQRILGGPENDEFSSVIQTRDGGLVAVGHFGLSQGKKSTWLYRAYADGSMRWQKTYGAETDDVARSVIETKDGHFAIVGTTTSGKGNQNVWLFIIDNDGKPMNYQVFGNRQFDDVYQIIELRDGGFAMAGYTKSNKANDGKGLKDFWVIKTNKNGEMVWERTFGGKSNDSAYSITETLDEGLVVVGYTFSHLMGANTSNAMVIKCDANGNLLWETTALGGKGNDEIRAVSLMFDGTIAMVGNTSSKSENAVKEDIWAIRFAPDFITNTVNGTELFISDITIKDNGDQQIEEGETILLEVAIENRGQQDAIDVNLMIQEKQAYKNLVYKNFRKIGIIRKGEKKKIVLPMQALEGLELGEAQFQLFCTDASRSRTDFFTLNIPTKPLEIPSDYLKAVWLDPNPLEHNNLYVKVKTSRVPIKIKARSDKILKRRHFTVFINGEPYNIGQKAGEASLKNKSKNNEVFDFEYQNFIDLNEGVNLVQVIVDNESNQDTTTVFQIEYSTQPNLHILAIGIEHDDLLYTSKDAKDFAQVFMNQEGKLFDKIYTTTLISGAKTAAGAFQTDGEVIKSAFANLENSYQYKIYEQDLLIIFLSSHGKTIDKRFKIVPTDFAIMGESVLLDYEKDIIDPLEQIFCHKLLLIDACHSGSYNTNDRVGVGMESDEADAHARAILALSETLQSTNTMASCRADESSWEDQNWENGAFTEAIIGALQNETYQDENGLFKVSNDNQIVTIEELYQYLQRRVPQMVMDAGKQGNQHPYLSPKELQRIKDVPIFVF